MTKRKRRLNKTKTIGEIYIEGTKYKNKSGNKDNIIEWLKIIQNKYN